MAPKQKSYLCCVTGQVAGERIIRAGGKIAQTGERAAVLSVLCAKPTEAELSAITYLKSVASECNMEMTVLTGENPTESVTDFIKQNGITHILTGMPESGQGGFVEVLSSVLPKGRIIMIPKEDANRDFDDDAPTPQLFEPTQAMQELLMAL